MAVVAGIVFFVIRGSLALVPSLATRRPIKKWAAAVALVAVFFYMLLSGSEVATQRSFIMIAIVLVGIMIDRPTLTFRIASQRFVFCCCRRRRSRIRAFKCPLPRRWR